MWYLCSLDTVAHEGTTRACNGNTWAFPASKGRQTIWCMRLGPRPPARGMAPGPCWLKGASFMKAQLHLCSCSCLKMKNHRGYIYSTSVKDMTSPSATLSSKGIFESRGQGETHPACLTVWRLARCESYCNGDGRVFPSKRDASPLKGGHGTPH